MAVRTRHPLSAGLAAAYDVGGGYDVARLVNRILLAVCALHRHEVHKAVVPSFLDLSQGAF